MKKFDKVKKRQQAIQELVQMQAIENQEQLVELLKSYYGIDVNQSIVSRDLRELRINKRLIKGKSLYEIPKLNVHQEILRLAVFDVDYNESLIVVKTVSGLAAFVGDVLDAQEEKLDILATLGGENVVFVVPRSIKNITDVYKKVCLAVGIKSERGLT